MTISTTTTQNTFTGNGVTTVFEFTFVAFSEATIQVESDGVLLVAGYAVTLNTNQNTTPGGSVAFSSPPANGVSILIYRESALTQGLALTPYGPFPADSFERALDTSTLQVQDVKQGVADLAVQQAADVVSLIAADAVVKAYATEEIAKARGANPYQATSDASTVLATGSSTARTLADRFADQINVMDFGVVGDGVADDTIALQAGLSAASSGGSVLTIPPGLTIRCTGPVFIWGSGSIAGDNRKTSALVIDADLSTGGSYFINCGVPSKGGTPNVWRGTISNLTVTGTPTSKPNLGIMLHAAEDFSVESCVFDWMSVADGNVTSVKGFNNSAWCSLADYRKRGTISRNTVLADQRGVGVGGEGLSIQTGESIVFSENLVRGVGDDPIGVHACTDVKVANNRLYGVRGRVLVSNSSGVTITGNHLERIAEGGGTWQGSAALIWVEIEYATKPAPTGIIISNNVLVLPSSIPATATLYPIRVWGARDVVVESNIIQNDSANVTGSGIAVMNCTAIAGWTDPTGLDAVGNARPRNITIANNRMVGTHPLSIDQSGSAADLPGPFYIKGNVAASYAWYANAVFDSANKSNAGDGAGFANVADIDGPPLATVAVTGITGGSTRDGGFGGAPLVTSWLPGRKGRVCKVRVTLSAAPNGGGYVDLALRKNGTRIGGGQAATTQGYVFDFYGVAGGEFVATDAISFRCIGVTMTNTVDAYIELYGVLEQ